MDLSSCTMAEQWVVANAAAGVVSDFDEHQSGGERQVRADVLVDLLTARASDGAEPRMLALTGAHITGQVALEALTVRRPLVLHDCDLDEPVILSEARAERVDFSGSRLPGLFARQLQTRADLILDGVQRVSHVALDGARIGGVLALRGAQLSRMGDIVLDGTRLEVAVALECAGLRADGALQLLGAHIGGRLTLIDAQLTNSTGPALIGDRLRVDDDMICATDLRRFQTDGEFRLYGAHIGGSLVLSGASLSSNGAPALSAAGLQVEQDVLCSLTPGGARFEANGMLLLARAHIGGGLDLTGARLTNTAGPVLDASGMQLERDMLCSFAPRGPRFEADGALRLPGAHIGGQLFLTGARLLNPVGPALDADGIRVDQNMFCASAEGGPRFEADGGLQMLGAHIGGELNFGGARLTNDDGAALAADNLQVDRDLFCSSAASQRFQTDGALRLLGAHIGGEFNCGGARLTNDDEPALIADNLHVGQNMLCSSSEGGQRLEADGLWLLGAYIGGSLVLSGACLAAPPRDLDDAGEVNACWPALSAENLRVDQDMACSSDDAHGQRFQANGAIRLGGAHIGSELNFNGAQLTNSSGPALIANSLHVEHDMLCSTDKSGRAFRLDGQLWLRGAHIGSRLYIRKAEFAVVDLRYASVAQLIDDLPPLREKPYAARLRGFTYQILDSGLEDQRTDREARLAWVKAAQAIEDDPGGNQYVPHVYDELAGMYRRTGRDDDAKEVLIAKQVRRRRALGLAGKLANYALAPIGYGYKTWRAAIALLGIVLIGWGVFALAYPEHMTALRVPRQLPEFSAFLYSLDAVLPVVNLGQEAAWSPTGFAQAWYAISVIAGWVIGLGLVAFMTARLFRE